MPDSLPLPKRLRQAAEALYGPTPAEMVAIRVLLREAAAALEALQGVLVAYHGREYDPDEHFFACAVYGHEWDRFAAEAEAAPWLRDCTCAYKQVWAALSGVAPRLPDGEPRTPSAPPPDPSSSVPGILRVALLKAEAIAARRTCQCPADEFVSEHQYTCPIAIAFEIRAVRLAALTPGTADDPRPQPEAEEPTLNPERGPHA